METLKLNFDMEMFGQHRTLVVEVPYEEGTVATSEFCPTEFLSGSVDLIAALRGERLDRFMEDCRRQLIAMSNITREDAATELEVHIGALMAVVMDGLSRHNPLQFGRLLNFVDIFALLLKADGVAPDEIRNIYPRVVKTIIELYPENILLYPDNILRARSTISVKSGVAYLGGILSL